MKWIVYRGEKYELIPMEKLTRPELSLVKRHTGMAPADLVRALPKMDLDAVAGYLLVAKRRAGEKARWADFDDMTMEDVDFADDEDAAEDDERDLDDDEDGEEPAPDPT